MTKKMITHLKRLNKLYYFEHYADHIQAQNERNKKTRHTERNRIATDLLMNNKTCPEESIYQIGIIDESISGEILDKIATEFFAEIKENSTIRSMKQLSITVSG